MKTKRVCWGKLKNHRGKDSEDTVRNHLGIFKVCGLIFSYTQPRRYSIPDQNGVDFFVEFLMPDMRIRSFPLQVKSSWGGVVRHKRKSNIPCLAVNDKTAKSLSRLIGKYHDKFLSRSLKMDRFYQPKPRPKGMKPKLMVKDRTP